MADAVRCVGVLPAGLRAPFASWDPDEPRRPFVNVSTMTPEVRAPRADHNVASDTASADAATALTLRGGVSACDEVRPRLPEGSVTFWRGHAPPQPSTRATPS